MTECKARLDLAFVIDGSGSIGVRNFNRILSFVKVIVRSFKIGKRFTRVGAILYSSRPYKLFGFNSHYTKKGIVSAVNNFRYPRGRTNTGRALVFAWKTLFRRNRRRGARKVLFLMTDGKSRDRVNSVSSYLRKAGINILTLGMGRKIAYKDLRKIATDSRHVFTSGFQTMKNIARIIKMRICRGEVSFHLHFYIDHLIIILFVSYCFPE